MLLSKTFLTLSLLIALPLPSLSLPTSPYYGLKARQNFVNAQDDAGASSTVKPSHARSHSHDASHSHTHSSRLPKPTHQDRPILALPDGAISKSSASRMGMSAHAAVSPGDDAEDSDGSGPDGTVPDRGSETGGGYRGGRWNRSSTETWTRGSWTRTWGASGADQTGTSTRGGGGTHAGYGGGGVDGGSDLGDGDADSGLNDGEDADVELASSDAMDDSDSKGDSLESDTDSETGGRYRGGRWDRTSTGTWTRGSWTRTRDASQARPTGSWGNQGSDGDEDADNSNDVDNDIDAGDDEDLAKREPLSRQGPLRLNSRRSASPTHSRRHHLKNLKRAVEVEARGFNLADAIPFDRLARLVLGREVAEGEIPVPKQNTGSNQVQRRSGESGDSEMVGMLGTVAIMSHVDDSTTGRKLASLYMAPTESDDGPYILNASEKNATQMYLVPASSAEQEGIEAPIMLQFQINRLRYCATYDPNPPQAEPLTMETCMSPTADASGIEPSNPGGTAHKSQTFSYNKESGVIRPMWFVDGASAVSSFQEDDVIESTVTVEEPSSSANSTDPIPAQEMQVRDTTSSEGAQNVTLVFVPATLDEFDGEPDSDVFTVTTTVYVTQSATPSPSASQVFQAAVSETSDSVSASMTPAPEPTYYTDDMSSSVLSIEVISDSPDDDQSSTDSVPPPEYTTVTIAASDSAASIVTAAQATESGSPSSFNGPEATASESESWSSTVTDDASKPASTIVAVVARAQLAAVDTAPYRWMFRNVHR